MVRSTRSRQSAGRKARNTVIEIVVSLVFLFVMLTFVLPWAVQYLVDRFTQ